MSLGDFLDRPAVKEFSVQMRFVFGAVCLGLFALFFSGAVQAAPHHANRFHQTYMIANAHLERYDLKVFARGTSTYFKPDAITVDGQSVYIAYQNSTAKDGSDHKFSTIVKYSGEGEVEQIYYVLGHCDGMRFNPYTRVLWVLVNNDANPAMYTINPANGVIKPYTFSSVPHGGGYDDLAFANGKVFISASNPTLNGAGVNVFPAIDTVSLTGSTANLTPVLMGNATAMDLVTHTTVTLNEVDPDSMSVDPAGDVVLANQAGSELVFLGSPGTSHQAVGRISLGTQVDDTVWATSPDGILFIVDGPANVTYLARTHFVVGTAYTEAPNDSGVASFVGTLDLTTGIITPVLIGFSSPTGLLFVPSQEIDNIRRH